MAGRVPDVRIHCLRDAPINPRGRFVLYWMTACRRAAYNFSLDRAVELAVDLNRPLVVLEALRAGYKWASDRFHTFIMQGMADNASALDRSDALYYPYVEPRPGAGQGLLAALAAQSCAVVTDRWPCFFIPRMVAAAVLQVLVRFEEVDGNGLLPLCSAGRAFTTAHSFRRFLQADLKNHFDAAPSGAPFKRNHLPPLSGLPGKITRQWPAASVKTLRDPRSFLPDLPIDHSLPAVDPAGGTRRARRLLQEFVHHKLPRYHADRNHPDEKATSGLSPYLHFGHISAHEVFQTVVRHENWFPEQTSTGSSGARAGWWGMSEAAEAFLDQLITWRELGFNGCEFNPDYGRFQSLPPWARRTLDDHRSDPREYLYDLEEFEAARTHDPVWNAAQRELVRTGGIHNYLRMLWGKKILEWTASPEAALETMIRLNDRYALDGRDPNSYSGIFWVLGRYDRAWGERPVFGKIRYMSSQNTKRKVRLKKYLQTHAG